MARPILLRQATLASPNAGQAQRNVDVLVVDGKIAAINNSDFPDEAEIVDATDTILAPGFVDTHRHVWQTQLRTTAGDWSLYDYLVGMRMTYSAFYQPDDVYLGNLVGAIEALSAGITTVVDHCHILNSPDHTDEAIRGLQDSGIRAVFCYGLFANPQQFDPFMLDPDMGWRRADALRIRNDVLRHNQGRVMLGLAPNEPESVPFGVVQEDVRFASELDAQVVSCHVAMGAYDQGRRVVQSLADAGLLNPRFLFVHGASLTDDELSRIADTGAGISSTPETELQMGMGHPVAFRARAAGAFASLGIDIVSSYSGEMFTQMRLALQAERARANASYEQCGIAPRRIGPEAGDAFRLATMGGAEAIGLQDSIGSIEVGKKADLILIRTDSVGMTPATNPLPAVVFNAGVGDVRDVMVDGRWVKRDGALVGVDWPALRTRLNRSAERIITSAAAVDPALPRSIVDTFFGNLAEA